MILRTALAALIIALSTPPLLAGGGWIDAPWHGGVRLGFNRKYQGGAARRDDEGLSYTSLYHLLHDYNFSFVNGDLGLPYGFELSCTVLYLSAHGNVDEESEDPTRHYHGFSDMWVGAKYQLSAGDYPAAVALTVRLPYLYQSSSLVNGQLLTYVPGLLNHDYDLTVACSHSITSRIYASAQWGFRYREGPFAHQVTFLVDGGMRLPFADDRVLVQAAIDGAISVSGPGYATSRDRFQPTIEIVPSGNHGFNYNNSSYVRPTVGALIDITPNLALNGGVAMIVWGINVDVYEEYYVQIGYHF